ncbi:GTPase/DUF3482 domain-containing protein [Phycisphaerales bacterium AB-hyl4]|uniref:GTPase/DUF3482 domain-containing protein n=1 Tax=Natronomicrosphaera hydrolytica TaxID=3242702 RepID=A0ABV4U3P2_9BACT
MSPNFPAAAPLKVAVVGHTNTGKTSLLRTLTRDTTFGEVSDSPATTRDVRGAALTVEGQPIAELYDTPGLEDPIALLERLEQLRGGERAIGHDLVQRFLAHDDARRVFAQEAKAIRQVMASDVALYVIDARESVLGKYRDEVAILTYCARPIVPVLNFIASPTARATEWRDELARLNLHAVAEFDTLELGEMSEQRLFEKMRTLLDSHREQIDAIIADRHRMRDALIANAANTIAELLIDAAAYVVRTPVDDEAKLAAAIDTLQQRIREREQRTVDQLLEDFRFRSDDYLPTDLPFKDGQWQFDLFNPETQRRFGVRTGGGAATGAAVGLIADIASAGLTLGTGTVLGAAIGGIVGSGAAEGRRLLNRIRGYRELCCDDATLITLTLRQLNLVRTLLRRGHASLTPVRLDTYDARPGKPAAPPRLPSPLRRARAQPNWSHIGSSKHARPGGTDRRRAAVSELSQLLSEKLRIPADRPINLL